MQPSRENLRGNAAIGSGHHAFRFLILNAPTASIYRSPEKDGKGMASGAWPSLPPMRNLGGAVMRSRDPWR
jgi:hypothetical protein